LSANAAAISRPNIFLELISKLQIILVPGFLRSFFLALVASWLIVQSNHRLRIFLCPHRFRAPFVEQAGLFFIVRVRRRAITFLLTSRHALPPIVALVLRQHRVCRFSVSFNPPGQLRHSTPKVDHQKCAFLRHRGHRSGADVHRFHVIAATALLVNRLGEREIDAIIGRVSGNKALPASVRQDIVERTDGIPLFVEEITKATSRRRGQARTSTHLQ
jgi:hypothetical protein